MNNRINSTQVLVYSTTPKSYIKIELRAVILGVSILILVLIGYAVTNAALYLAALLVIIKTIKAKSCVEALIPFSIIITWGAEIWNMVGFRLYTIIRVIVIVSIITKYINRRNLRKTSIDSLLAIICFIIYFALRGMISGAVNINTIVNLGICYTIICFTTSSVEKGQLSVLSCALATGVLISVAIVYISPSIPRLNSTVSKMILTHNRYGVNAMLRMSGLTYDPNLFGLYALVSASIVMRSLIIHNYKNLLEYILLIMLAISGVLTMSKAYIVISIVLFGIFLFAWMSTRMVSIRKKALACIAFICLAVYVLYALNPYINAIQERFDARSISDMSSGRTDIWKSYIEMIFSSIKELLLGHGFSVGTGQVSSPHNIILYLLYYFGLLGTVIYLIMISCIYKTACGYSKSLNRRRTDISAIVPLACYFTFSLTIDPFMLYDVKMVILSVCFMSVRNASVL